MAYGIQVYNSSGATVWDSTVAASGIVADVIITPASGGGPYQYTYPDFAGRTVNTVSLVAFGDISPPTVDTALGYPRVTVPYSQLGELQILVAVF
jgi:hypothetical protein